MLIVSLCKEQLHKLEFVNPIEELLRKEGIPFTTKRYDAVTAADVACAGKIILCGTSLHDNDYLSHLESFAWLKECTTPVLGICAGMQVLGLVFNGSLKEGKELGFYEEEFTKRFYGLEGRQQVYHLHGKYVEIHPSEFLVVAGAKYPQAILHRRLPLAGVLFHPEVRNTEMLLAFCRSR